MVKLDIMSNLASFLYVESQHDALYVERLLKVAGYPTDDLMIIPAGGKSSISKTLSRQTSNLIRQAALIDLDSYTVFEAQERARQQLGNPNAAVFCAVPTLEAWLFADMEAAIRHARSDIDQDFLRSLPLPEEIPLPKQLATKVFGRADKAAEVFDDFDITVAASRSPSLRLFLEGMREFLNVQAPPTTNAYGNSIDREIFSNLLSEVSAPDTIIFRTLDGTNITAAEMLRSIREGSELGRQYASDLLRVARDLLARKAQREAQSHRGKN